MQEPFVPAHVILREFAFMPLDVARLCDSDLAAEATGDEFRAAVLLWCKSWHQVPAASLPNNDAALAHLAGCGRKDAAAKEWARVRKGALRGWVLCSDGRFYHPVIAEKALEAWERRDAYQGKKSAKAERQQRWRDRIKEVSGQLREAGVTPPAGASLEALERLLVDVTQASTVDDYVASTVDATVDATEIGKTGTGTGTGTGKEARAEHGADAPALTLVPESGSKAGKKPRGKSEALTFRRWLETENAAGRIPVPPDHRVFAYAAEVGLPDSFVELEWEWFAAKYGESNERQASWSTRFLNAVKGAWGKLWWLDPQGKYQLSTTGVQLQREIAARTRSAA